MIALFAGAAASLGATAQPRPAVEIKDAVARVTVIPEDRADIRVEVVAANPKLPLKIRQARSRTVIDGGLQGNRIRGCNGTGAAATARVTGLGEIALKAMPHVVIRAPRSADVYAGGAVFGDVGRSRDLTLGNAGCGDWTIANVERQLKISLAGSGDVRAGSSGGAKLRVAGEGDIATAAVRGGVDIDLAGSGDVKVASLSGPLDVHMAGSGDVVVARGRATSATVAVAGSGNVIFGGVADTLNARVTGSGDVRVKAVRGQVKQSVVGSGAVRIG